jgi:hypothetical protein
MRHRNTLIDNDPYQNGKKFSRRGAEFAEKPKKYSGLKPRFNYFDLTLRTLRALREMPFGFHLASL